MKVKKTFKKIEQRIMEIIAAVLRVLVPQFCCKSLTLKTREYARLFLPGKEKELSAIFDFNWSTNPEELRARYWSPETRLKLINQNNFALVSDITTKEELLAVVEKGTNAHILQAMRVYSPGNSTMAEILERFYATEEGQQTVAYLTETEPKLFQYLSGKQLLGSEGLSNTEAFSWNVAITLAEKDPKTWAKTFLELVVKVDKSDKELFDVFFKKINPNEDVILDLITKHAYDFPEQYAKVRDDWSVSKKYNTYLCSFFRKFKGYLQPKDFYTSFKDIYCYGKMGTDIENAYELLKICYYRLADSYVFDMVAGNLDFLKLRIHPSLYQELIARMLNVASCTRHINSLIGQVPAECEAKLFGKLVEFCSDRVLDYFPFTAEVCTEELSKKAVLQLAKKLPLERLGELSEDLQKLAVDTLELLSQLDAVAEHKIPGKLLVAAEVEMISRSSYGKKEIISYAEKFGLSAKGFKELCANSARRHVDDVAEILEAYVKVRTLTEEQYLILMQSGYAYLAPSFKNKVQSAE